jgi:hypothetical protein
MSDLCRLRCCQRRTAIAAGLRGIVKGASLVMRKKTMRMKSSQTTGMSWLGRERLQRWLGGAQGDENQQ